MKSFNGYISNQIINVKRRDQWRRYSIGTMTKSTFRRWQELIHNYKVTRRFELNEYGDIDGYFSYSNP